MDHGYLASPAPPLYVQVFGNQGCPCGQTPVVHHCPFEQNAQSAAMSRKPLLLKRDDWASDPQLWNCLFEGRDTGAGVTVLFCTTGEIGQGPRWHLHPYDEIFSVHAGR